MTSKWKKIISISLILIVLEVITFIIVVLPFYKVKRVYDCIDGGRWYDAKECYDKLSSDKQKSIQKNLDDYGAYIDKKYVDGKISYEEAAASFDAIGCLDETELIKKKYLSDINEEELNVCIKEICKASRSYDTKTVYELKNKISGIQKRMDGTTKEKAFIRILNMYYQDFLDEKVSDVDVHTCTNIVTELSYYDAYTYAGVVSANTNSVMKYRSLYATATQELSKQNYVAVLEICTNVTTDPKDTNYQTKFAELASQAKSEGVEFYKQKLDGYLAEGKKSRAIELLDSIEPYFGEELNLASIKNDIAEDWQLAFINVTENLEENIKKDVASISDGSTILSDYDNLRPDSLLLKDINGDLIPEMFFFNSANEENTYVGCFIYGYVDGKAKLLGFVNVRNFGDGSYLIGFPLAYGRTAGDEYSLIQYDGTSFSQTSYCQEIGDEYYIDGSSVSNIDYLSGRKAILDHAGQGTIKTSKYKALEDAQKYILSY